MALDFTSGANPHVDATQDTSINDLDVFTFVGWVRAETVPPSGGKISTKGSDDKNFEMSAPSGWLKLSASRATTDAVAEANFGLGGNKWYFLAATYDETDGPRIFQGDLTTPPVETPYISRMVGAGATLSDAPHPLRIGNNLSLDATWPGDIDTIAYINERLSLDDLKQLWRDRRKWIRPGGATRGYWELGRNGTGTQPDYSGNLNNGTVTGATVALNAPLAPTFGFEQPALTFPVAPPKELGYFDVSDFGATGAGVTNDAPAIQAALEAAGAAGGGVVFFPPRTYKIGTQISVANLHNLTIDARGALFTLPVVNGVLAYATGEKQVFKFSDCNHCTWLGGKVEGGETFAGWTAYMDLNYKESPPAPAPGIEPAHDDLTVFIYAKSCHNLHINELTAGGMLRLMFLETCKHGRLSGIDWDGILPWEPTPDRDNPPEHDTIRTSFGIVMGGCDQMVISDLFASNCAGGVLTGSQGLKVSFVGINQRLDLVAPRIHHFHGNALYLIMSDVSITGGHIYKGKKTTFSFARSLRIIGGNARIVGVQMDDAGTGISISGAAAGIKDAWGGGDRIGNVIVQGCVFRDLWSVAVQVIFVEDNKAYRTRNVTIRDCQFIRCATNAGDQGPPDFSGLRGVIRAQPCSRLRILDNLFEDCQAPPQCIHVGLFDAGATSMSDDIDISGNRFAGVKRAARVQSVSGLSVRNNRSDRMAGGSPDAMFELEDVVDAEFDGNWREPEGADVLNVIATSAFAGAAIGANNRGGTTNNATTQTSPRELTNVVAWWSLHRRSLVLRDATKSVVPRDDLDLRKTEQWIDRINGTVLSQATLANKPSFYDHEGADSRNGKAYLDFDGTDDYLSYPGELSTATSGGVFIVFRDPTFHSDEQVLFSTQNEAANNIYCRLTVNTDLGQLRWFQQHDASQGEEIYSAHSTIAFGSWYVAHFFSTGTAYGLEVNGNTNTLTAFEGVDNGDWFGDTPTRNSFSLGARIWSGAQAGDRFFGGQVAEVVVYDGAPPSGELTGVTNYLKALYRGT